jgi:hypothetical protein
MTEEQCPHCGDFIDPDSPQCSCCWVCDPGSVAPTWGQMCPSHGWAAHDHIGEIQLGYLECGDCLFCNNLD